MRAEKTTKLLNLAKRYSPIVLENFNKINKSVDNLEVHISKVYALDNIVIYNIRKRLPVKEVTGTIEIVYKYKASATEMILSLYDEDRQDEQFASLYS